MQVFFRNYASTSMFVYGTQLYLEAPNLFCFVYVFEQLNRNFKINIPEYEEK
jgi:hypothetical protein